MRPSTLPWRLACDNMHTTQRWSDGAPSVNVALEASFDSPPFLVELLETAASENSTCYFPLLDRIADGAFSELVTEEELYDDIPGGIAGGGDICETQKHFRPSSSPCLCMLLHLEYRLNSSIITLPFNHIYLQLRMLPVQSGCTLRVSSTVRQRWNELSNRLKLQTLMQSYLSIGCSDPWIALQQYYMPTSPILCLRTFTRLCQRLLRVASHRTELGTGLRRRIRSG